MEVNFSSRMSLLLYCLFSADAETISALFFAFRFQITQALGRQNREDVDIICAGINHQTWYISVKTDGIERTGELYR